jgi:hypothetical protein
MRPFTHLAARPIITRTIFRPTSMTTTTTTRPLSSTRPHNLKEDKPQTAEEIEHAKQNQHHDAAQRENLESASEAAVKAERHGKGPEELQAETAREAQRKHQEGK